MIEGSDARLYGVTSEGGAADTGTIFKLNKDGSGYTILHNFPNGFQQNTFWLIEASDKQLYGTTFYASNYSHGTVFKVNRDGSGYTMLYAFAGTGGDGSNPTGVMEASDGVLYGTTRYGGTNIGTRFNGTVFKLNKDGSGYRLLHLFNYPNGDGSEPTAPPIEATDGALYGTTIYGGNGFGPGTGAGTVFKMNKDGSSYVVLHIFTGDDGEGPSTSLLQGTDGAMYGATEWAGATGYGTLFRLNTDGSDYKVLHVFSAFDTEGRGVISPLVEGPDGTLYGTTALFGGFGRGTVFKMNKDGSGYTVLRRFTGVDKDGNGPTSLVKGSDGSFYGLTATGGEMDFGSVFLIRAQWPVMMPPIVSGRTVSLLFRSDPGSTNQIQRASTLGGNWLTVTNIMAATNGIGEFTDPAPLETSRFYRVVRPGP
jgi:uncharacterized repeat protein (TIGR03803 family)